MMKLFMSDMYFYIANFLPRYSKFNSMRCFMYRIAGANIGHGAKIDSPLRILTSFQRRSAANIYIGARTYVNSNVRIFARDKTVTIGCDCLLGPDVLIETSTHSTFEWEENYRKPESASVTIGNRVWLCARSVILPGVEIGDNAIVAAGAVVTRNVPANTMFGGVPARFIKYLPVVVDNNVEN